jgi:hypothetical protein
VPDSPLAGDGCEAAASCSRTLRTAPSRTSGENLFDVLTTPSSQEMESPGVPGRFSRRSGRPATIPVSAARNRYALRQFQTSQNLAHVGRARDGILPMSIWCQRSFGDRLGSIDIRPAAVC